MKPDGHFSLITSTNFIEIFNNMQNTKDGVNKLNIELKNNRANIRCKIRVESTGQVLTKKYLFLRKLLKIFDVKFLLGFSIVNLKFLK